MAQEDRNELPVPVTLDDQNKRKTFRHLPNFFRTDANKKFLGGTMDVLTQPGTLTRISSYVGRKDIPNYNFDDTYIQESSTPRQYYQLEPSFVSENNVTDEVNWYGDYIDYINSLKYFGANVSNHSKLNKSESYTFNPHIDWDKFVNYREYYWLPNGPDPVTILGEIEKQDSEFTVTSIDQGDTVGYIFTPDGLTVNPRLTLYRGLTYRFNINTKDKFFSIKTRLEEGDSYFYDIGVSDRKVEKGSITWTVPFEAPDLLYYMDNDDRDTFGIIDIRNIDEARTLNVEQEILGKKNYTSSFGIKFVNGLKVKFEGQVTPSKYLNDFYYVDGVGSKIVLVPSLNLEAPATFVQSRDVPWDDQGFDSLPFDNADNYPGTRDYMVINRSSIDRNNWSRANRWFHRNVLETSANANKTIAVLDQDTRAIRPIIEFEPNLKLYKHGWKSKGDIDLVDNFTTDVFSIIEGSAGYTIDGEPLVPGYKIIFTADTDILVKGRIFEVKRILNTSVNADEQISVISTTAINDTISVATTQNLKVGQKVQFIGTVVGGLDSSKTYYVSSVNFTATTFSVSENKSNLSQLVQLIDSAVITMKVSAIGPRTTSRKTQLTLQEVTDSIPTNGDSVYVTKGKKFKGSSFYYDEGNWKDSQKKIKNNQVPLFDLFDSDLDSYSDNVKYPFTTFNGNKVFGYKIGTGANDTALGFPIIYRNITNIGDIEFEFDLQNTSWNYVDNTNSLQNLNSKGAYLRRYTSEGNFEYSNGWVRTDRDTEQNVVRILKVEQNTSLIPIDVFDDNQKIYALEEARRISTQSKFYIAKQSSSGRELDNSQFWNNFVYNDLYKEEWLDSILYSQGEIVKYRNFVYVSIADPLQENLNKLPTDVGYWSLIFKGYLGRGDYSRSVIYDIDDIIRFDGSSYICIKENQDFSPTNLVYWKKLVSGDSRFFGEFDSTKSYQINDIVSYGLYLYVAQKNTTDFSTSRSYPPIDREYWAQLASGSVYPDYYNKKKLYNTGDIVVIDNRPKLDYRIRVYVNDKKRTDVSLEAVEGIAYIKFENELAINDKVVYKIRSLSPKNLKGYYEIPNNWQNNPFNQITSNFTLGEVIDHVRTITENVAEFNGDYPGISNLANLGPVSQFGRKFMQHTGLMPLSTYLMVDKDVNLIKSLRWNAKEYTQFKKEIILKATQNAFDGSVREIVDQLLINYSQAKFYDKSAFYYSDVLAFGAASVREYDVIDPRFPVFVIDSFYDPKKELKRSILIYVNEDQILFEKDYVFSEDDAFVTITKQLSVGDKILIKDYPTTDGCYVPTTPTALGLYPLYEPKIYQDDTYVNPVYVIAVVTSVEETTNKFVTNTVHGLEINDSITFLETDISTNIFTQITYYVSSLPTLNSFTVSEQPNGVNPVQINIPKEKTKNVSLRITYSGTSKNKIPETSTVVIQGHDGSIIKTYGDYRDNIILEIEKRIFNNVRVKYDSNIFNIDDVMTGYYRRNDFTKSEINNILLSEFLRWNSIGKFDFNTNTYFKDEESFTYNYNQSLSPNYVEFMYGYWRGIYKYFYDTDRPHTNPWEMQGFTIKPIWWDNVYGLAPYTSDNKIMWDAIEQGLINDPVNRRIEQRYSRPGLKDHLPVDDQGKLLSPLNSRLAKNFSRVNALGRYAFGDQAPVETAWRRSEEFPFAVLIACSILRSSEFVGKLWDRISIKRNLVGQIYSTTTHTKINTNSLPFANDFDENNNRTITKGLANIVDEYVRMQKNIDHEVYKNTLRSLDVKLSYRLGGFTSKEKVKVLLDSRTPNSSGTIFLPEENYKVFYNKSAPVNTVNYSGVIIEKIAIEEEVDGYRIDGYDREKNSFEIFLPRISKSDPTFNVGGVSESFVEWAGEKYYPKGQIVRSPSSTFYRAKVSHTSGNNFEDDLSSNTKWQSIPFVPIVGGRNAVRRTKFNTTSPVRIPYGTVFADIQSVVDFLLGYQERLKEWGFEFEQFSKDLNLPLNWFTSSKEFMFWTLSKWPYGSIITLSPAANYLKFKPPISASVDNLDADFYEYSIFKSDGKPLRVDLTNIYREDNGFEIKPSSGTKDGIFHIRTNLVYQEHVLLFDNESIFGDVIYDIVPGYRQGRLKLLGFKTNKWDGSYYTPGFMYDNAQILEWEPNTDYNIGDIVQYQNFYYTALSRIFAEEEFDYNKWNKLDEKPEQQLISNFDYRIEQFKDYYSLEASNYNNDQQNLARHLTGYQPRQYLENVIIDDVSQYKFYQGFIKEKGTFNSITKLFDALRASGYSSINLKEEWAFKVGDFGASDAFTELEFKLDEEKFVQNPQNIVLTNGPEEFDDSSIYNIIKYDVVKKPNSYNSTPFVMKKLDHDLVNYGIFKYRTAGYVNPEDIDHIIYDENTLFNYNLDLLKHRDKIWIGNTPNGQWNVMAYYNTRKLIINWDRVDSVINLYIDGDIGDIEAGDIISVRNLLLIDGIYRVIYKFQNVLQVFTADPTLTRSTDDSTAGILFKFESVRYFDTGSVSISRYNDIKIKGEKLWIDNDSEGFWKVLENDDVFTERKIIPPAFVRNAINEPRNGHEVKVSGNQKFMFVGVINNDNGAVLVYNRPNNTTNWSFLQTIRMPRDYSTLTSSEKFGYSIDVSDDGSLLVIGAPDVTNIKSKFRGDYNPSTVYVADDVVRHNDILWKKKSTIDAGTSSTPSGIITVIDGGLSSSSYDIELDGGESIVIYDPLAPSEDEWDLQLDIYEVVGGNTGYNSNLNKQGAVFTYVYNEENRKYYESDSYTVTRTVTSAFLGLISVDVDREQIICSYDPQANERFGSKVKLHKDENGYWLFVTSENYNTGTGRVQIFRRNNLGAWQYNPRWNIDITYESVVLNDQLDVVGTNYLTSYPGPNSRYGYDIEFNGQYLIISAPFQNAGTVYVFELLSEASSFRLVQVIDQFTINTGLVNINDLGNKAFITDNAYFGYSLSLKNNTLFVSCPNSDINDYNVGSVYQFTYVGNDSGAFPFNLENIIVPPSFIQNERFGITIDVGNDNNILAVSAAGGNVVLDTSFDTYIQRTNFTEDSTRNYELDPLSGETGLPTIFDSNATLFFDRISYTGAVYIFNRFGNSYIYADKLNPIDTLFTGDNFGYSVSVANNSIIVGSPTKEINGTKSGMVYVFDYIDLSWKVKAKQDELVDINKFKKAFLYNSATNTLISNLDFYDPVKGVIPGQADQEIKYQTLRDPASYEFIQASDVSIDQTEPWTDNHVGELWWDLSSVKWIWYEQGSTTYRNNLWGTLFPGSSIDVYEWVETTLLPSEWLSELVTQTRNDPNINGTPIYINDLTYSTRTKYDPITGFPTKYYYYWVRNKTNIPRVSFRSVSAFDVAQLILDPAAAGLKYIAVTSNNSFSAYNIEPSLKDTDTHLNLQFYEVENTDLITHREYALLSEDRNTIIPEMIENKWFDSLCGYNKRGQPVPDTRLSWRERYGAKYEPRQSWFINRFEALKQLFEYVNLVLSKNQVIDDVNFSKLNSQSLPPVMNVGDFSTMPSEIDQVVDIADDLRFIGTQKLKTAEITPIILEGRIIGINIVNPGYGYKTVPTIKILGTGTGAKLQAVLDSEGRVGTVKVLKSGQNYEETATILRVRNYSVLVKSDEEANGRWSIYDYSGFVRKRWGRIKTQAYNVTLYWDYADWYAEGYDENSEIVFQVERTVNLNGILAQIGDTVKVTDVGGNWLLLLRKAITETPDYIEDYDVIGRQNGTIKFSDKLYNLNRDLGYDLKFSFDLNLYDQTPQIELRLILETIRDNILTDNLREEYLKVFFNSVRYALNENLYVDWVFKTSFLKLNHVVGELNQRKTFQSDELESYQKYIEEVKPYKSKIREFLDSYDYTEMSNNQTTDFDLFSSYNYSSGQIERTSLNTSNINFYPWRSWAENRFYQLTEIEIYDQGDGYISIPKVIISGDGRDASATAYIAKGKVFKIIVDNPGYGYTYAPTIYISGGNSDNTNVTNRAKAIARIGNSPVRTNHIIMKYDRIASSISIDDFKFIDRLRGDGRKRRFKLTYAPDPKKINFNIFVNNIEIYGSGFEVEVIETIHGSYTALEGYVTFAVAPSAPLTAVQNIVIEYDKNIRLLDAANRIEKSYNPTTGMYGKDLGLLLTGVDYGGVQLTSIDFEIGGGWDVLPWETSSWDNVVTTNDDFVIAADTDSTHSFDLPYVPARGEIINIYINDVRVDDPYFDQYDGSTPQPNGLVSAPTGILMNSFVGDGINNEIFIPYTYTFQKNDFITLRKSTSDGTILPTDRSLLDTFVEGGDLTYSTAQGINAEEIIIDGDGLVTSDTSHGPEELVQGQVVDALEINVYHTPSDGGPNVLVKNYTGDGITDTFDIGYKLTTISGIIVISNDIVLMNVDDSSLADNDYNQYKVDFQANTVTFNTIPADGDKIAIITIDTAGFDIKEKVSFIGDGSSVDYLLSARYDEGDFSGFVTINGISTSFEVRENVSEIQVQFKDIVVGRRYRIIEPGTTDFTIVGAPENSPNIFFTASDTGSQLTGTGILAYDVTGNIIMTFDEAPLEGDIINVIIFRGTVKKWSEITTQHIPLNYTSGNNNDVVEYEYPLNPLPANIGPLSAMAFVIIDNQFLQAPDYEHFVYDGNPMRINDLRYNPYTLKPQDIDVYKSGVKLVPVKDYLLDSAQSMITLNIGVAQRGDEITIEIYKFADFKIDVKGWDGSSFTELSVILNSGNYQLINQQVMRVITFTNHDIVKIKTSNVGFRFNTGYDVQVYDITQYDILSTAINTSGIFNLPRTVGNNSGVFVALNRQLLSPNVDYVVLDNKKQIKVVLPDILGGSDYIQIITFNDKTVNPSYGFKLFKDMINRVSYKRLDDSTTTKLLQDLTYLDTRIVVENGDLLPMPNKLLNLPGVVEIENERIEYLVKNGNVLSQLRRGTLGTGIKTVYSVDTPVYDLGPNQTVPYSDEEIKKTFYGDGSTQLFPLDFKPRATYGTIPDNSTLASSWYRATIPWNYGQCDELEVFVGGRRLRKNPIKIYDQSIAQDSFNGAGDRDIEAEFSVDNINKFVRLTDPPENGELVVIVCRTGRIWQNSTETSSLVFSSTSIARFLRAKQVNLPK